MYIHYIYSLGINIGGIIVMIITYNQIMIIIT